MAIINLRDYYPFYRDDVLIEVPDTLVEVMNQWIRDEKAYARKQRWHHAQYSLDYADDTEKHILAASDAPDALYEKRVIYKQLQAALSSLSETQVRRLYAHYCLGLSKAEIARAEGVTTSAVRQTLSGGLCALRKHLKKNL